MIDIVRLYPKEKGWNCKMQHSEWKGVTAGGPLDKSIRKSRANPQFILHIEQDAEVCVSLMQKDYRYDNDGKSEDIDMTFFVVKIDESTYNTENPEQTPRLFSYDPAKNVLSPSWNWGREVSASKKLTKGSYIIVPCTTTAGVETEFFVRVFTQSPVTLRHIEPLELSYTNTTFEGQWKGDTAGGNQSNYSWIYNPQFRFRINAETEGSKHVQITLRQNREDNEEMSHIGMYVMNGNERGAPVFDRNAKVVDPGSFKRLHEVSVMLLAKHNQTYNIVPCSFNAGEEGKFTVTVSWAKDSALKVFVQPTLDFPFTTLEGAWTEKNAGGSRMQKTYPKNPKYSLQVKEETVVDLVLAQKTSTKPLAIGLDIVDVSSGSLVAKNDKWNYQKIVCLTSTLKPGNYAIIPSTFNANQLSAFDLKLRSASSNFVFKAF
jgi:hypothetical protein